MPRATHRKSRHGCVNCKQRRVKCDEQKPSCERCISREITCKYLPATTLIWTGDQVTSSNGSTPHSQSRSSNERSSISKSTPSNLTQDSDGDPALNLQGIALIIHWFTKTVYTVVATSGPKARALETCQTVILDQAMEHPFLLHGLLALSALHLVDMQSLPPERERYTRLATSHHSQGLALYQGVLDDVNATNHTASIAFSSLTAMFAFALYRPDEKAEGAVDDFCRLFMLAKGWGLVVGALDHDLGILSAEKTDLDSLDEETAMAFVRLHELNRTRSKIEDVGAYTLAIESLKSVFNEMSGVEEGSDPHVSMAWMAVLPEKCIRLFQERQGLALLLLAFYCVVLARAPQVWWLRGWSTGLLGAIREDIAVEYRDEMKWVEDRVA